MEETDNKLPLDLDIKYNVGKIIDLVCAFTRFTFDNCVKATNDKWTITNKFGICTELTNEEMFYYFMEKTEGDKTIWK